MRFVYLFFNTYIFCIGGLGEIYIRARVTTNLLSKCVSSVCEVATPINHYPKTVFNIDVLWKNVERCLSFVYPVLDVVSNVQTLTQWENTLNSSICFITMMVLSWYSSYIPLYVHYLILKYMYRNKKMLQLEQEKKEKEKRKTMFNNKSKSGILSEALRKSRHYSNTTETTMHNTKDRQEKKEEEEKKKKEEKNENGFGNAIHLLLKLMPHSLKETLTWTQDILGTVANGLEYVDGLFKWKNRTVSWSIFIFFMFSSMFFVWSDADVWSGWLGVLFVISGTTPFTIGMTTFVGLVTTISTLASPPLIVSWIQEKRKKMDKKMN